MLALLLVAAVVFAVLAWLVEKEPIQKVSVVLFVICAVVFLILILLQVAGHSITIP